MTLTSFIFKLPTLRRTFRTTCAPPAAEEISERKMAYTESVFLRELMARNPEAIQSDLGLMAIMTQYPRYF